jgi:hypothetical protein
MIELKNEIEDKYPGLIKAMSKIRTYLKNNDDAMKSFIDNSGYSRLQALKIFTLQNLIKTVKVSILSDYGEPRPRSAKCSFENIFVGCAPQMSLTLRFFKSL